MQVRNLLFFVTLLIFSLYINNCMCAQYQPLTSILIINSEESGICFLDAYSKNKNLNEVLAINDMEGLKKACGVYVFLCTEKNNISTSDLDVIRDYIKEKAVGLYNANKSEIDLFISALDTPHRQILQQLIDALGQIEKQSRTLDLGAADRDLTLRSFFCDPRIAIPIVFVAVVIFFIIPAAVAYSKM